ncbi:MAG: delta-60 repeat domain-containing protein [Flavobacteriales bacterium]|nr:delta-60 repeat domain-containing protein [Flavobacteriales bacterium]
MIACTGALHTTAQDGALDLSFNTMDVGLGNGDAALYGIEVRTIAVQPNGSMVVGGNFQSFEGITLKHLVRVLPDGSVDPSFAPTFMNSGINCVVIQPSDGKILVGGQFYQSLGAPYNHIARLNTDGTVDASFNPVVGPDFDVNSIALQADGKILIGGAFTSFNGTPRNHIARLNSNGSLDTGFNPTATPQNEVLTVVVDGNGKILVGGGFAAMPGTTHASIARYNSDGSVDVTFNTGAGATLGATAYGEVNCISVLPDERILIGGHFSMCNGGTRNNIAALLADGRLDAGFTIGTGSSAHIYAIAQQPDSLIRSAAISAATAPCSERPGST